LTHIQRRGAQLSSAVVIILAPQNDVHARTVGWEIEQRGGRAVILDTADFPTQWRLTLSATPSPDFTLTLADGHRIDGDNVTGLWWRRVSAHLIPDEVADHKHREFCRDEARALLDGWAYALGNRVMNPLAAELAARRKPYQLVMAARMKLDVPATCVTNDPADAAAFDSEWPDGAIYKVLTGTSFQFTETRAMGDTERKTFDLLRLAPVIFQQRIGGGPDVRVTIVDGQVFAAELNPKHPEAQLDWRLDMTVEAQPHDLPGGIAERLSAFQRAMGLRYGAYDLRRDASGRYVFFEVNPGGQFLFVEIHARHRISAAVAEALLGGALL